MITTPSNKLVRELPWVAAIAVGFVAWVLVSLGHETKEAWDLPIYFQVVLPALTLAAGFGAWLAPWRAVAIAPAIAAGQLLGLLVLNAKGLNLWPIGVLIMGVMYLPAFGLAIILGRLHSRRAAGPA